MRSGIVLLAVLCGVGGAGAIMPPEVYEEARENASDVLVLAVEVVIPPNGNMGTCTVRGRVLAAERGERFEAGDSITLGVSCLGEWNAEVPIGGTIWQGRDALVRSRFGRAFLEPDGSIALDQYEQLSEKQVRKLGI